ncbi:MAG: hypothetical protein JW749_00735 [Sedimentisphaerales bacterium]|nr:hypothetical protein [Sedimentisphaerales bacterium]
MRGFKNWPKALEHCYLSEYPRGRDGVCPPRLARKSGEAGDLRKVI